jgi:hypothetical protein
VAMAPVDDAKIKFEELAASAEALSQSLAGVGPALTKIAGLLTQLRALLNELDPDGEPGGNDGITFALGLITPTTARVTWDSRRTDILGWRVGRDGQDSGGAGPWSTVLPPNLREHQFNSLKPSTTYGVTLTPVFASGEGTPLRLSLVTGTAVPPDPGTPTGVAQRLNWGQPHNISDQFTVNGRPDSSKWRYCGEYGVGWKGHAENGRRMPENTFVQNGLLVMRGDSDGKTGWLRQNLPVKQGRWEICCRSRNTGPSGGLYHPLFLIWPTSERWPQDGELDLLEYEDPNSKKAKAYLHYPHNPGAVQQIPFSKDGVDMTQWHVFSFEWTRQHVRSWIDGEEWYFASGGATASRRNIQDMPEGRATIQLDNFTGNGGLRPAVFEFQYVNFYAV